MAGNQDQTGNACQRIGHRDGRAGAELPHDKLGGSDPFDRRQWRRKGDVDLDPRGHRGHDGYRLRRNKSVMHQHRFWRLGRLRDARARCAAVAEGHSRRMKRRDGLTRVAGSAPWRGRGRHVVADRRVGYRSRPHCRLAFGGQALHHEKLRGIAAGRAEIHLRRIEIRLRVLVDARDAADAVDDVSHEVRRGAFRIAALPAEAVVPVVVVGMAGAGPVGDRGGRVRTDDQQRRGDHAGSRRDANC